MPGEGAEGREARLEQECWKPRPGSSYLTRLKTVVPTLRGTRREGSSAMHFAAAKEDGVCDPDWLQMQG